MEFCENIKDLKEKFEMDCEILKECTKRQFDNFKEQVFKT